MAATAQVHSEYSNYQGSRMFDSFLEIGFEAELNTDEHPELPELAKELCNEYPETRAAAIQELRDTIYERGECQPRRTDDAFLLRFLRARRFNVTRAHRLLVRYCAFLEQYPYLYKDVDLWSLSKLRSVYGGVMYDRPGVGRLTVMRFGTWDTDEFPVEDVVRCGLAMLEIGIRNPKLQVVGGTLIVDMEGITLKHITTLSPTVVRQIVFLLGVAMPNVVHSTHFINYNWLLNTFFFLFKQLLSRNSLRRIHFHPDLRSLHEHIDPACLPVHYGGELRGYRDVDRWFAKIRQYRDGEFDKEMKEFGYLIKE